MLRRGGHGGASVYAFLSAPVNANVRPMTSCSHFRSHTANSTPRTVTHLTPPAHGYLHMGSALLHIDHRCPGRFLLLPYGGGEPLPSLPGRIGSPSLKRRKRRKRCWQRHNQHSTIAISNESQLLHRTDVRAATTRYPAPGPRPQAPGTRHQIGVPSLPCRGRGRGDPPFFWPGGQRGAVLLVNATLSRSLVGCLTFAAPTCA